jgi:PASTA domain
MARINRAGRRWTMGVGAAATLLVVPLATGASSAQANVIANGEFAQGLTGWSTQILAQGAYAGYPHFRVITEPKCDASRNGNPFLEIDVPGGARGYVEEQFAVPAAPGPLTFLTWGNLEPVQVTISAVAGGVSRQLLAYSPPTLQSSVAGCSGATPVTESLDVAALAGQTIDLRLEATSSGHDGTIADFDNFSLEGTSGSAKAGSCLVPKLAGLRLAAAKRKLAAARCRVGAVRRKRSSHVASGRVISSSPGKGSRRSAGTKVKLVISR